MTEDRSWVLSYYLYPLSAWRSALHSSKLTGPRMSLSRLPCDNLLPPDSQHSPRRGLCRRLRWNSRSSSGVVCVSRGRDHRVRRRAPAGRRPPALDCAQPRFPTRAPFDRIESIPRHFLISGASPSRPRAASSGPGPASGMRLKLDITPVWSAMRFYIYILLPAKMPVSKAVGERGTGLKTGCGPRLPAPGLRFSACNTSRFGANSKGKTKPGMRPIVVLVQGPR